MQDTVIDFIRHGEPEGGRRFRGDGIDDSLSEKGRKQMWDSIGERAPWSRIISSPLKRCTAFASELADKHALSHSVDDRFREIGFGEWEGQSPDDIIEQQPEAYKAFYEDPVRNRPGGAESLDVFGKRVSEAFEDLIQQYPNEHLLVVAHAGVIRAALGHVMQAAPGGWYRARVDYASFTRFSFGAYGYKMVFSNRPSLDC